MADYDSSLPIRTQNPGDAIVKVADATTPSQQLTVNVDGSINSVVSQTTHNNLNANANIQVGDVDVSNSNPVPISDAGASITVDGTVTANQGTPNSVANSWPTKVTDGTDTMAVNTDGSINVVIADSTPGTPVNDFKQATAIAAGATDNHDYTVTAATTLNLNQIESSASGKAKMTVQVETGVGTNTFNTRFVQFNSTASPIMHIKLENPIAVAAGVRVRVIMQNNDNQAQDLYSTISGYEI